MKFKKIPIRTGLGRKLFLDFKNITKKILKVEVLFKIVGDKWNTKEFVYIQIYDDNGHIVYTKKLRFFGDKLIDTP